MSFFELLLHNWGIFQITWPLSRRKNLLLRNLALGLVGVGIGNRKWIWQNLMATVVFYLVRILVGWNYLTKRTQHTTAKILWTLKYAIFVLVEFYHSDQIWWNDGVCWCEFFWDEPHVRTYLWHHPAKLSRFVCCKRIFCRSPRKMDQIHDDWHRGGSTWASQHILNIYIYTYIHIYIYIYIILINIYIYTYLHIYILYKHIYIYIFCVSSDFQKGM